MNGNGTPTTGNIPTTDAMLIVAWTLIHAIIPATAYLVNGSLVLIATFIPAQTKARKASKTVTVPNKPISSPITAKIKSVCASGPRLPHFWRLPPKPTPKMPPEASAIMLWAGCQPAPR